MLDEQIRRRQHRAIRAAAIARPARRIRRRSGDRPATLEQRARERVVGHAKRERLQACGQFVADERRFANQQDDRRGKQPFGRDDRKRDYLQRTRRIPAGVATCIVSGRLSGRPFAA